ncbi:720_t:CDS:1, partial [Diversispora eburnea]
MLEVPSMERSFMSGSSTDDSHLQILELGLEEASQPGERQSRLYDELMSINITRSSSEESQNLSNSSGSNISEEMGTIAELANTIDGYLDNPRTNRTILSNQIKRATRQIRRKYDNLQTDLINEQRRRYNAEVERDLRQTDLDNALNDLNMMTTAYNNERVTCQ